MSWWDSITGVGGAIGAIPGAQLIGAGVSGVGQLGKLLTGGYDSQNYWTQNYASVKDALGIDPMQQFLTGESNSAFEESRADATAALVGEQSRNLQTLFTQQGIGASQQAAQQGFGMGSARGTGMYNALQKPAGQQMQQVADLITARQKPLDHSKSYKYGADFLNSAMAGIGQAQGEDYTQYGIDQISRTSHGVNQMLRQNDINYDQNPSENSVYSQYNNYAGIDGQGVADRNYYEPDAQGMAVNTSPEMEALKKWIMQQNWSR
jgi:hypothetical protein